MFPDGEYYLDLKGYRFEVLTTPSKRPRRGPVPAPSDLDATELHTRGRRRPPRMDMAKSI